MSPAETGPAAPVPAELEARAVAGGRRALEFHCVQSLCRAAAGLEGRLGFVGGAVRDWMLDSSGPDVDLLWTGEPAALAAALEAGGARTRLRPHYRTMSFPCGGLVFDVASPRRDRYPVPGGVPEIEPAGLEEDLLRRDFTANAMVLFIEDREHLALHDPLGGTAHVAAGELHPVADHTLAEDPMRLLRGARYLTRFDWRTAGAWTAGLAAGAAMETWRRVAPGRLWSEARAIADEPDPAAVWDQLRRWGLDRALLGAELPPDALAAMARWRREWGAERRGTGRNWLVDAAILHAALPRLLDHVEAVWRPQEQEGRRLEKFLRKLKHTDGRWNAGAPDRRTDGSGAAVPRTGPEKAAAVLAGR